MRWSVEEHFKSHSMDKRKRLEISHWDALLHLKSLFELPMAATLSLQSDKEVIVGKTLKHLTKLLDWLHGIGHGYDEGMESRTIMVPANGMVHKLREELKNDGALLFGLIFFTYGDIGGKYFCSLFPLFAFYVYFTILSCIASAILKTNIATSNCVNL